MDEGQGRDKDMRSALVGNELMIRMKNEMRLRNGIRKGLLTII